MGSGNEPEGGGVDIDQAASMKLQVSKLGADLETLTTFVLALDGRVLALVEEVEQLRADLRRVRGPVGQ